MRMTKRMGALAVGVSAALLLAACGGGGSAGTSVFAGGGTATGTAGATVPTATLTLALSSTTVTAAAPATATATVKNAAGAGVAGRVVSFRTTGGLGTFSVATALTDASGVATVALYPAASTTTGADTVVASSDVDGTTVTADQGFALTATNVTISSFTSDVGASRLSAYSQTNLSVKVAGAAAGTPVSIALTSTCVTAGKATLTPAGTASTTNGTVTFTYKDLGCGGTTASDSLQATVVGSTSNAALALALATPAASSITFTAATPDTIYLKGSGFVASSTVSFKVVDIAGSVLPNLPVLLEPTTLAGGLTLDGSNSSVTKTSDSNGVVSVLVNSGTVPTPVRIKATLTGSAITTVSSSLAIAVGLPSETSFSLSQTSKNIEGFDIDGTPNAYSIIASDRLGNPVPAGTAINFVAEGGQVEATKQVALSANGIARATANYVSASTRPADGRVTVLAYTLGEESFLDTNGDNVYTAGELFQDLGDVFLDRKFDGIYDPAADQFISLSLTGSSACNAYTASSPYPSSLLAIDATIPSRPSTCDGVWGRAYVRRATETVLSTSAARPLWGTSAPATLSNACAVQTIPVDSGSTAKFYVLGYGGLQGVPGSGSFSFLVADANNNRLNPMAAGTTVTATATTGLTANVTGGSPVPSSLSVTGTAISYEFGTGYSVGTITLAFRSPSGLTTTVPLSLTTTPGTGAACPL